jgi:hypothetical protein
MSTGLTLEHAISRIFMIPLTVQLYEHLVDALAPSYASFTPYVSSYKEKQKRGRN